MNLFVILCAGGAQTKNLRIFVFMAIGAKRRKCCIRREADDRSVANEMTVAKRKEYCVMHEVFQGSGYTKRAAVDGSAKYVWTFNLSY